MKLSKIMSLGFALAAFATVAEAGPTVRIVGSTAFRRALYTAVTNTFAPGYLENNGTVTPGNSGATKITWSGTVAGFPGTTTIKISLVGSTGGVDEVVNSKTLANRFLLSSTPGVTTAETGVADITLCDSFQESTPFNAITLDRTPVGVITFAWVKNVGAPSTVTNITSAQARNLLAGPNTLALFTGVATDVSTNVYCVGRDDDSGTRTVTFAESGYGVSSSPLQYFITNATPGVATLSFAPGGGAQGYAGGGDAANALKATGSATSNDPFNAGKGFFALGYLGSSDAAGVNGGANNLLWNGVQLTDANVKEGTYSFWAYESIMNRPTAVADVKNLVATIATRFDDGVINAATKAGIRLSQMNSSRNADGGDIAHN